jgi:flagellar L-ring protein precursor FlgH
MTIMTHPRLAICGLITTVLLCGLGGCSTLPPEPLKHSPNFEPVFPQVETSPEVPTGAIYGGKQSESWFGKGRNYQVGDVITVLVNESTQASRTQNNNLSRESSNDAVPQGLTDYYANRGGWLKGTTLSGNKINSKGAGEADQQASLVASVAVAVVEVMRNGNLVVRGEKQLALTEGAEIIQVSGIVRTDDIAPNNTVQSRRLANAQIVYRGSGDLANATRAGWGTSALLKLWPF